MSSNANAQSVIAAIAQLCVNSREVERRWHGPTTADVAEHLDWKVARTADVLRDLAERGIVLRVGHNPTRLNLSARTWGAVAYYGILSGACESVKQSAWLAADCALRWAKEGEA